VTAVTFGEAFGAIARLAAGDGRQAVLQLIADRRRQRQIPLFDCRQPVAAQGGLRERRQPRRQLERLGKRSTRLGDPGDQTDR
jgi:hypothetical protein